MMFSGAGQCKKVLILLDFLAVLWYNSPMINDTKTTENVADLKARIAQNEARIAELETLVKYYEAQFRLEKQRQFGASSEKGEIPEQLGLFDEAENTAAPKQPEPSLEEITYTRRKREGKREEDLSGLPVVVVEHKLPEDEQDCPECGESLHEMGHDIARRELEIVPAQVRVIEHKRAVYSCRNCEKNSDHVPIVKAPTPEPLIKGSLASPSAVAHIIHQKYVMAAPLYRQEQDWQRQGIVLTRQTMANWVIRCSRDWLELLYNRMRLLLLTFSVLHADETVLQVLKEPGKAANTNSYMWLYRTSGDAEHPIVLYEYQPTRSSSHPKRFLEGWNGYLHTDGYDGYHKLPVTVVGCWVHMRRKFTDALKTIPPEERADSDAGKAIEHIAQLFRLETLWKDLPPEERFKLRLEQSKPLAEFFYSWLDTLKILPKMPMGKAIHYALSQKRWLMNVYLDGRTELSNNRAENSIRPFVIGRKNWLFCNTQRGARASSVIYSLIETAKENGLKPFEYLKFLLETVLNTTTGELESLLPWGDAVPEGCRMPKKD
jgi:transposase